MSLLLASACLVTADARAVVNGVPTFGAQNFTVPENSQSGALVGKVLASDPDGDALQFSIVSGNRTDAFAIHPGTGELTVNAPVAIDYEAGPLITLLVRVADSKGAAVHNFVRVNILNAPRVESVAPVISLSQPANNASVLGLALPISGTASDNAQVALVLFQVNGGFWHAATGTTSWNATARLEPGANVIAVKCIDTSDNHSAVVTVSNVVASIAGTYDGLFHESGEVRHGRSGSVSIKVTARHTFSASLKAGGNRYAFSGVINSDGTAETMNSVGMEATLRFTVLAGAPGISGEIILPDTSAEMFAYRRMYSPAAPSPLAGQYTLSFSPTSPDASSPEGFSAASLIVRNDGSVRVSGFAGDGTSISAASSIASNGQLPFYFTQYRGRGSMLGWLSVTNGGANHVSGDVSWIKAGGAGGRYPNGFTNQLDTIGSSYINMQGNRLLAITNGAVQLSGGDLLAPAVDTFTFSVNNTIAASATKLRLTVSPANGKVTGYVVQDRVYRKIQAVILQQQNVIRGVVVGTRTGTLSMESQD